MTKPLISASVKPRPKVGIVVSTRLGLDPLETMDGMVARALAIQSLLEPQYDTRVILRTNRRPVPAGVLRAGGAASRLWSFHLLQVILRHHFDYVYCVGDRVGFLTWRLLAPFRGYRLVFEATEYWSRIIRQRLSAGDTQVPVWQKWGGLVRLLERLSLKGADSVTAVPGGVAEYYRPLRPDITVVPIFVDEAFFHNPRAETGLPRPSGPRRLGIVGPFNTTRNQALLDFAYASLGRLHPDIRLVVIGRCDQKIDSPRIEYTGYLTAREDYVRLLCGLDGLLMVSKAWDPGPHLCILEAMACSLPVFSTPDGLSGIEHITPGENAFAFSEDRLVAAVNRLIFEDAALARVGRLGRDLVKAHYGKQAARRLLLSVLEGLERRQR